MWASAASRQTANCSISTRYCKGWGNSAKRLLHCSASLRSQPSRPITAPNHARSAGVFQIQCRLELEASRLLHISAHRHVAELSSVEEQGGAAAHFACFFNVDRFDVPLAHAHFFNRDGLIRQIHNHVFG